MEPLVVSEKLVALFKFWLNGQLHDGMRCQNELFRCIHRVNTQKQQQLYSLGVVLAQKRVETIITASKSQYTLWVSLRSSIPTERTAGTISILNAKSR